MTHQFQSNTTHVAVQLLTIFRLIPTGVRQAEGPMPTDSTPKLSKAASANCNSRFQKFIVRICSVTFTQLLGYHWATQGKAESVVNETARRGVTATVG